MSDCVYTAYLDYQRSGPYFIPSESRLIYDAIRSLAQVPPGEQTYIGLVPLILRTLFKLSPFYNAYTLVEVDPRFTPETWIDGTPRENAVSKFSVVDRVGITPGRGIYCDYYGGHAFYHAHHTLPETSDSHKILIAMSIKNFYY